MAIFERHELGDALLEIHRGGLFSGWQCKVYVQGSHVHTGRHGSYMNALSDGCACAGSYSQHAKAALNSPQFNAWGRKRVEEINKSYR